MSQTLPTKFADFVEFTIPEFKHRPPIVLNFTAISEGERRLYEAKTVNPGTYSELEFTFGEGYRSAKKCLSMVSYEITQTESYIRKIKSEIILDEYPSFIKENKLNDNATNRDAFLERNVDYTSAKDRVDMLKALEHLLEGKVKVFENVCRYMRKEMDILIRSGVNSNKYGS